MSFKHLQISKDVDMLRVSERANNYNSSSLQVYIMSKRVKKYLKMLSNYVLYLQTTKF